MLGDLSFAQHRFGFAGGDGDEVTGGELEVTVDVGGVALDGDFEGVPIEFAVTTEPAPLPSAPPCGPA